MGNRKTPFILGNFYHCYSRGIDKCLTFLDDADYRRFVENMYIDNRATKVPLATRRNLLSKDVWELPNKYRLVKIVAYCLMPNHFHLVLEEITENGISIFMQRLTTSYTMYFKTKYARSGGLFTRPFRAKMIDTEWYLHDVINYIHLNPLELIGTEMRDKDKLNKNAPTVRLENYTFSSLPDYTGQTRPERVLLAEALP